MSEALLIMALGLVLAVGFTLGLIRRRRFREAAAPAGAAASVLRDTVQWCPHRACRGP